jgi:DNA-binding beta-propeller fold protein YncE
MKENNSSFINMLGGHLMTIKKNYLQGLGAIFLGVCVSGLIALFGGCTKETTPPTDLSRAGWICDSQASKVMKYKIDGSEKLLEVDSGRLLFPQDVAVDTRDGSCWVADTYNRRVVKLSASNGEFLVWTTPSDWFRLTSVAVDRTNGNLWIADHDRGEVHVIDENAGFIATITGFRYPFHLAVDQNDGGCWVADQGSPNFLCKIPAGLTGTVDRSGVQTIYIEAAGLFFCTPEEGSGGVWTSEVSGENYQVGRYDAGGNLLGGISGLTTPGALALDEGRGVVWVCDNDSGILYRVGSNLTGVSDIAALSPVQLVGFSTIVDMAVDRETGNLWVVDRSANQVVIVSPAGDQRLVTLTGFEEPSSVSLMDVQE